MPPKKTPQEFLVELKDKAPDIIPLESYINSKTKIKCECALCGNHWSATPAHLLSGEGCPVCGRRITGEKKRYTKEEFQEKLRLIHPEMEVTGEYINSKTKIEVHCNKCGNTWSVVPASLLHGTGCPKCNKRFRRNTQGFIEELHALSPHITVLGNYKNAHEKIQVKCNRCGTEWYAEPNGLLKGNDCPVCGHSQSSIVEQVIYNSFCCLFGKDKVLNRDRTIIGKELDIVIQDLSLAIEFGAWYWHSDKIKNDSDKEKLCDDIGIRLLTIYEGCPEGTETGELKNAICYTNSISSEKDFHTIRGLIISVCDDYHLDCSEITKNWSAIIKQSREETRKKDAEQFAKELSEVNPDIEYVEGYSGAKERVKVRCKKCGTEWLASSAYDLLHGTGCPKCVRIRAGVSQRLSPEEFRARVSEINPDIELLDDYNGPNIALLCRCKKCGTEWKPMPGNILYRKRNCPTCSPVTRKTNDQFLEELYAISDSIIPLEDYKNNRARIHFKCLKCGYEWLATPKDVLRGTGCPKCANRLSKTTEEFITLISQKNDTVEIIGEYKDSKTKVKG